MHTPRILLYTSDFCSYCVRAKNLLTKKGVSFEEVHLDRSDTKARMDLVELTGRYTVPQVLIDDRPIGGYDDMVALDHLGRLDPILGIA